MKPFYRVCNPDTEQGLWYDFKGKFTGLIHTDFDFCTNSKLEMDFDPELVGWLSAVEELDQLYHWFSEDDIMTLQEHGWFIHEYQTTDFRFYERFSHSVIDQSKSVLKKRIVLL